MAGLVQDATRTNFPEDPQDPSAGAAPTGTRAPPAGSSHPFFLNSVALMPDQPAPIEYRRVIRAAAEQVVQHLVADREVSVRTVERDLLRQIYGVWWPPCAVTRRFRSTEVRRGGDHEPLYAPNVSAQTGAIFDGLPSRRVVSGRSERMRPVRRREGIEASARRREQADQAHHPASAHYARGSNEREKP